MRNFLVALLILCNYTSFCQGNAYEKVWQALNQNKKSEADDLFHKLLMTPQITKMHILAASI